MADERTLIVIGFLEKMDKHGNLDAVFTLTADFHKLSNFPDHPGIN